MAFMVRLNLLLEAIEMSENHGNEAAWPFPQATVVEETATKKAIAAMLLERGFQKEKYPDDMEHTIAEWLLIMKKELIEAEDALIKGGKDRNSALHEVVQVCTTGLSCLIQHGTEGPYNRKWGDR